MRKNRSKIREGTIARRANGGPNVMLNASDAAHPFLQRIALELQDPAKVSWKMPDWAKFANMSGRSLSRLVQAETSLTFNDWRLRHIFVRAASSIMQGKTVEETAYDSGYHDTSAFIAAFRRFFGTTPGKFRLSLFADRKKGDC